MNPIAAAQHHILELLTRHMDLFLGMGHTMFIGAATILIAWFGIQAMLRAATGDGGLPLGPFASLVMTLAIGHAMITYYDRPLPAIGYTFPELITEQAYRVAASLEASSVEAVLDRLDRVKESLDEPEFYAPLSVALYLLVLLAITMARIALIFVIVFGDAATAVCVLLGPLFIPFFVLPQLDWLYWGWLKALFQYAWYKVVAHAFVFIFGQMLLDFFAPFGQAISFNELLFTGVHMIALLLVFSAGLLLVPVLTSSILSGGAGGSLFPSRIVG
jgi:hypothetical protein